MKNLSNYHFFLTLSFLLSSSSSFSRSNYHLVFPQDNWHPIISICTVPKMEGKKEYKAHLKIFYNYEIKHKAYILCRGSNTGDWENISIKVRGKSSASFAKKQYLLKFRDPEKDEKKEISFGGLPKDSKWAINAPYVDRSRIRNIFIYDLSRKLGQTRGESYFAPRTKNYELFLNNEYNGFYVLMEKIGRGKDKVDIKKLKKQVNDSISFIAEISSNDGEFRSKKGTYLNYVYPSLSKLKEIGEENKAREVALKYAIQKEINKFEKILKKDKTLTRVLIDPKQKYFDVDSFIDFILIQEISKNVDGFRRSAFFHRKANGKIHMGPLWDFNLAFGNLSFYGMSKTGSWLYLKKHSEMKHAFWFKALIRNKVFRKKLINRYFYLRNEIGLFSTKSLLKSIDHHFAPIKSASQRDHFKWHDTFNFTERYIINTKKKGDGPQENIDIMKKWLQKRLIWIDHNIKKI